MRIETSTVAVHAAIHLDDEPRFAGGEVGDEAPDDHLPAEGDAQATAAERGPEALLRERSIVTQPMSFGLELELTLGNLTT